MRSRAATRRDEFGRNDLCCQDERGRFQDHAITGCRLQRPVRKVEADEDHAHVGGDDRGRETIAIPEYVPRPALAKVRLSDFGRQRGRRVVRLPRSRLEELST
jgi:hypothetical protein